MTTPGTLTPPPVRTRTRTYCLALLLHALVITALWAFGRHFSA